MSLEERWSWEGELRGARILALGRGAPSRRNEALAEHVEAPDEAAWLEQIHSAEVIRARRGLCGRGDGLVSRERGLALSVATADCLPVVVADGDRLTVAHAGWRGLAAGVLPRAVAELGPEPSELHAWIGPAIGPCCYEVGEEVVRAVLETLGSHEATSLERLVRAGRGARPHLDLPRVARLQLVSAGVERVEIQGLCTRCNPDILWSYRLQGGRAGRNLTFAWLR